METDFYRSFFFLSDEELIDLISTRRAEFSPEAVAAAENLLLDRGYEIAYDDEPVAPADED